jgi:hypothetical protein
LVTIVEQEHPPLRFMAGADSIGTAEQKIAAPQQQIASFRGLSTSLAFADAGDSDRRR